MIIKKAQIPDVSQYETKSEIPDVSQHVVMPKIQQRTYTAPQFSSNEAVKNMQLGILIFARTLAEHPVMSMQEQGKESRDRGNQQEYLGGTNPFGNFLVNQYINNENVVGKQFVNIDAHEPVRSDSAIPNVNLKGIINTISRIGTPGAERQVDGIWQTRTNNALKQIYAFAAALLQLQKDMGIKVEGFSEQQLEQLKELIPDNYLQLQSGKLDISDRATAISDLIAYLVKFYKSFESSVLNNKEYKDQIMQTAPFISYEDKAKQQMTDYEKDFFNDNMAAPVPGAMVGGKQLTLIDLTSIDAFKKFLTSVKIDPTPENISKYIQLAKDAIQTGGAGF